MINPLRLVVNFLRLFANKDFYSKLYENLSGSKRDNTIAVWGNSCLLLSAILRSMASLIESNQLSKIQKYLSIIQYHLRILLSLPTNKHRNINRTILNNYSNKYIVNHGKGENTKVSQKLGEDIRSYAKILRSEYTYIADIRIFNHILCSISYVPDLIDMVNNFSIKDLVLGDKPANVKELSLKFIDKLQIVNCFFIQIFEDLAFIGDRKFLDVLTKHSLTNWYVSSKFWFFYVLVDLAKYTIEHPPVEGKYHVFAAQFANNNKSNFLNLILAYHWGFDWSYLNDYQLAGLNLNNYVWKFKENWSDWAKLIATELTRK